MATEHRTTATSGAGSVGGSSRRRRLTSPIVIDPSSNVPGSLEFLADRQQSIAFVAGRSGVAGIVTIEDLRFALDWLGPEATVADAMTFGLVEVAPGASSADAAEAFADGLLQWLHAASRPSRLTPPDHEPPAHRGPGDTPPSP